MKSVDARHREHVLLDHEAVRDPRPIHGFHHLLERLGAREAALRRYIGVARVHHRREALVRLLTKEGDLLHGDFHPEETTG